MRGPPSLFGFIVSGIQLVRATSIYLNPATAISQANLQPQDASFVLSKHFGLEFFEIQGDGTYAEELFVGKGFRNGLLLTSSEEDAKAILPPSVQPTIELASSLVDNPIPVLTTYIHRARHSYPSVFAGLQLSSGTNVREYLNSIDSLSNFLSTAPRPIFAALDVSPLTQIRSMFGPQSEEYAAALEATRQLVHDAITASDTLQFALLTYPFNPRDKRAISPQQTQSPLPPYHPAPQEPIGSISTCFTTSDACINGTSSCSGRGKCVEASKAGRSCFVCACDVTKTGTGAQTKTEIWVGESCERKDISGPFVLLTGTVVVMILLLAGSVGLLYGVGIQELPSVLMGSAVGVKRD